MADNISDLSVASEEATLAPSGSGSGSGRGDGGGGDSDEKGKKSSHKKDKHQVVGGTLQILTAGKNLDFHRVDCKRGHIGQLRFSWFDSRIQNKDLKQLPLVISNTIKI